MCGEPEPSGLLRSGHRSPSPEPAMGGDTASPSDGELDKVSSEQVWVVHDVEVRAEVLDHRPAERPCSVGVPAVGVAQQQEAGGGLAPADRLAQRRRHCLPGGGRERVNDMRLGRASACLLTVVTLATAGCADEGKGDDSSWADDATTQQDPGDQRSDAERQEDEAIAETALLTLDDFPAGWEAVPAEDGEDDDELVADLAQCLEVDEAELDPDNPTATSPTFTSSNDEAMTAEVSLTPSSGDASRALEILQGDAALGCYAEAIKAEMARDLVVGDDVPENVEVGEPTLNRISFESLGDESVAFRTRFRFRSRPLTSSCTSTLFSYVLVEQGSRQRSSRRSRLSTRTRRRGSPRSLSTVSPQPTSDSSRTRRQRVLSIRDGMPRQNCRSRVPSFCADDPMGEG